MRGFPLWPAKVSSNGKILEFLYHFKKFYALQIILLIYKLLFYKRLQISGTSSESNMVDLIFYGDKTTARMYKNALVPFDEGFATFVPGKRVLLDKAVKEALYEKRVE